MNRVLVLILTLLLAACGAQGPDCGANPSTDPIPGVGYLDTRDATCSAILLSPNVVMTAGHCVTDTNTSHTYSPANLVRFTLDKTPLQNNAPRYAYAGEIQVHPGFLPDDSNPGIDVALIHLTSTAYGTPFSNFVPFGAPAAVLKRNQVAVTAGYGDNRDGTTGKLRYKQVLFSGFLDLPTARGSLTNGLIQVLRGPTGEIGCSGDSGSSLIAKNGSALSIVGVFSTGEDTANQTDLQECISGTQAGDYVSVDTFRTWVSGVRQNWDGNVSCK